MKVIIEKAVNTTKKNDFWAIIISVLGFAISCFNYYDVHNQLILMAGQVKAYTQVIEVSLVEPITDASFIKLKLRIKNFGQTAATNVYGEMDYDIATPDFSGEGNSATRRDFGSLGPGLEKTIILTSNRINDRKWPTPSHNYKTSNSTIYFFGTIWYTDDTSKEKRKEDWCYALVLKNEEDLKKLDLEQSTTLIYKSKNKE